MIAGMVLNGVRRGLITILLLQLRLHIATNVIGNCLCDEATTGEKQRDKTSIPTRVTGDMQITGVIRMPFCSRDPEKTCAIGGPSHILPSVTNQMLTRVLVVRMPIVFRPEARVVSSASALPRMRMVKHQIDD